MPLVSKQLDVLRALTAHLEGISVAAGYTHDLAGRVVRGRAVFGESDPTPMLSILEGIRPDDGRPAGPHGLTREEDWILLLQGWAEDDRQNPLDPLYQLKASVEQRLSEITAVNGSGLPAFPAVHRLGGRVLDLRIGPGVCRPPDQISARSYFYLPLAVRWHVNLRATFLAE